MSRMFPKTDYETRKAMYEFNRTESRAYHHERRLGNIEHTKPVLKAASIRFRRR